MGIETSQKGEKIKEKQSKDWYKEKIAKKTEELRSGIGNLDLSLPRVTS